MTWDEGIRLVGAVLQTISILATALFAIAGLDAWRRQMVGKRRMEIAEEVLACSFRFRDAMNHIRSPMAYNLESKDRAREAGETEGISKIRDSYYVPLARIKQYEVLFNDLTRIAYLAEVYFGTAAVGHFDELRRVLISVRTSAAMLIEFVGEDRADLQLRKEWESNIWDMSDPNSPDHISLRIINAVRQLDGICRSSLSAIPSPWFLRWLVR